MNAVTSHSAKKRLGNSKTIRPSQLSTTPPQQSNTTTRQETPNLVQDRLQDVTNQNLNLGNQVEVQNAREIEIVRIKLKNLMLTMDTFDLRLKTIENTHNVVKQAKIEDKIDYLIENFQSNNLKRTRDQMTLDPVSTINEESMHPPLKTVKLTIEPKPTPESKPSTRSTAKLLQSNETESAPKETTSTLGKDLCK